MQQPAAPDTGRTFRIVTVSSVRVALPDQYPLVTLEDAEVVGRSLSFRIGLAEGAALVHALEGTSAPRPSTHDLFAAALQRYAVDVLAVRLVGRIGATYLAELDLVGGHGRERLSCRPSDGICLALRQRVPAPVLADDRLFTQVGDVLPDETVEPEEALQPGEAVEPEEALAEAPLEARQALAEAPLEAPQALDVPPATVRPSPEAVEAGA